MDGAAAPLQAVNGQHPSPEQQTPLSQAREKTWQPRTLLARFRARVSALKHRDETLPVARDLGDSDSTDNTAEAGRYTCDVGFVCADAF